MLRGIRNSRKVKKMLTHSFPLWKKESPFYHSWLYLLSIGGFFSVAYGYKGQWRKRQKRDPFQTSRQGQKKILSPKKMASCPLNFVASFPILLYVCKISIHLKFLWPSYSKYFFLDNQFFLCHLSLIALLTFLHPQPQQRTIKGIFFSQLHN